MPGPHANHLPIDDHLPRVLQAYALGRTLVLTAEPGAGKTTRLPAALLDQAAGEVWVLEPRRLAARLAAQRVASERGVSLGEEVGYQVRFDTRAGPRTRLRYVTEGILTRRLGRGDDLTGVACVVLDEFHERHVETDLALALLDRLRATSRPDLGLVVMSATLDAAPIASYLHDAPVLEVPGRLHPIQIDHAPRRDERYLDDRVHDALGQLLDDGLAGHVLVFLPGTGEIRRCERTLAGLARANDLAVHPLHGRLQAKALEQALRPSQRRKVLLATNVAESSVTIDGVAAVIDSGLARVAGYAPQTGLPTLELRPIGQASATQRANRAGRQGPGRCLRLYTKNDHDRRPAALPPELLRTDLASPLLALSAAGVRGEEAVRWLDPPPAPALQEAARLLRRLGAVDGEGVATETGRAILRLPLSPRLGRTLLEGSRRGVGPETAAAVALLSERSLRRSRPPHRRGHEPPLEVGPSDVLVLLDLLAEARAVRFDVNRLRAINVDAGAARTIDRTFQQLKRSLPKDGAPPPADVDAAVMLALLAGHPDRVAKRQGGDRLALAGGGTVQLSAESAVREAEWLIVLDAADPGRSGGPGKVRLASAIEPEWLLELFADELTEASEVRWDPKRERVEARWELRFGALTVESAPESGASEAVRDALRQAALDAGPEVFAPDKDAIQALQRRLTFARQHDPDLPALDDDLLRDVLAELCDGRSSFAELRKADLWAHVQARLGYDTLRRLDALAPTHVRLHGGCKLPVTYETRQPPWVKSRLQDFFGMSAGPTVANGRVPLVLHLAAPNKQAVSVTSDLASFWARTYPVEMKALRRRYPKHLWPEDPASAKPPKPGRIR